MESLDRSFENVCELDLIFHFDEVNHVLSEIIQGGLVLETNINEISSCGMCYIPLDSSWFFRTFSISGSLHGAKEKR